MTLSELKELIELVSQKGFAEFEVEREGFRLRIVATRAPQQVIVAQSSPASAEIPMVLAAPNAPIVQPAAAPQPVASAAELQAAPALLSGDEGFQIVKSPIVGTFYRSPSPTSDVFVNVGDRVSVGDVLCIVEAMKLMNEIESEYSGEIVKVFVENGQPVEYGQSLFAIRP